MRKCVKCGAEKPATSKYFHTDNSQEDGLNRQCKTCIRKYQRDRYKKTREQKKELGKVLFNLG